MRQENNRLVSLDALRGITIAGMILVNSPGSWEHIYAPFRHASWNGLTLADLVFPFFLFIVGASIQLSLSKRLTQAVDRKPVMVKIAYRAAVIFAIGMALNLLSSEFRHIRVAGVLQRIALCYAIASFFYLFTSLRVQIILSSIILLFYWIIMMYVPIPEVGNANFTFDSNWAQWIDSRLLPGYMYFKTWDPEGILSTFPAIVTTMLGLWAARWIAGTNLRLLKLSRLLTFGLPLIAAGLILSIWFPVNKNVWSSSYVLLTAGLASVLWALFVYLIDIKQLTTISKPWIVFGMNAIFAYVFHATMWKPLQWIIINGVNLQSWWMEWGAGCMPIPLTSLIWAVAYTIFCYIPVYWLYKRKIFLKV